MNEKEPIAEVSIPNPPEYLVDDEIDTFVSTAGKLARMRVMTEYDVDALAVYSVNFVRWKGATAKVREMGMIVKSPKGYPIQNPFLSIANKSQAEMLRILTEFGLTPSSRTRVHSS
jgi:P27 family predicted phage terminase small subunit